MLMSAIYLVNKDYYLLRPRCWYVQMWAYRAVHCSVNFVWTYKVTDNTFKMNARDCWHAYETRQITFFSNIDRFDQVNWIISYVTYAHQRAQLHSPSWTTSSLFMCSSMHLLAWFYARQNHLYIEEWQRNPVSQPFIAYYSMHVT